MSLIQDAARLKFRFQAVDQQASRAIRPVLQMPGAGEREILPCLREYVRIKYLLEPEDMGLTGLEELGKRSLERVRAAGKLAEGMDVSPHCGSASSATHKKILLVLALQRDLDIHIPPMESADSETLPQLAACVGRALARRGEAVLGEEPTP